MNDLIGLHTTEGHEIRIGDFVQVTVPSDKDNSFYRSNAGEQTIKFNLKTFVFYVAKHPWYELLLSMHAFREDLSFLTKYEFYSHRNDDYERSSVDDGEAYDYLRAAGDSVTFFRYMLKKCHSEIVDNDDDISKLVRLLK